jgi:preprotein translocase subunit SecE
MSVVKEKQKESQEKTSRANRSGGGNSGSGGGNRSASREQRDNAVVRIYRETRTELRKVVWPTREETIRLTLVVLAISSIIGVILFTGDSFFLVLYNLLVDAVS